MLKPKEKELFDKYPDLFYYALCENDSSHGSGYHEPIKEFGFETSEAWFDVIAEACEKLKDAKVRVTQIKQKFGGLRFYVDFLEDADYDYVNSVIHDTEVKCETICEVCGKEGKVRNGSWVTVLCEEHYMPKKKRDVLNAAKKYVWKQINYDDDEEVNQFIQDIADIYSSDVLYNYKVNSVSSWNEILDELFNTEEVEFLNNFYWEFILHHITSEDYWKWYSNDDDSADLYHPSFGEKKNEN